LKAFLEAKTKYVETKINRKYAKLSPRWIILQAKILYPITLPLLFPSHEAIIETRNLF